MTKDMHGGATAPEMSVAERKFREAARSPTRDRAKGTDDTTLEAYARVWHDESVVSASTGVTEILASGDWALGAALGVVWCSDAPQTKRFIAVCIADAWLAAEEKEEDRYVAVLQDWPILLPGAGEDRVVASAIRSVLEARHGSGKGPKELILKLARFFAGVKTISGKEHEVWRTVFKAIGKYADVWDFPILATVLLAAYTEGRGLVEDKIDAHFGVNKKHK